MGETVRRPRMIDLFSGAGGCAVGYDRAGFDVVGVDIEPQPRYPFEFHQADALEVLSDRAYVESFDAIHASPTCQSFARVTDWRGSRSEHPNLLAPTLELLATYDLPWVVENVPEAPLRADYLLCGTQFGLPVRRHRIFERGNWQAYELIAPCQCYRNRRLALGCEWMTNREGRQAIPPAYTEYIGGQLMAYLTAEVAA